MKKSEVADFTVQVLSDDENKYLIAEIYYGDFLICLVDTEFGDFGISFYSDPKINYKQEFIHDNLDNYIKILHLAKVELEKFPNGLYLK